jgi:proteasome accessory factor B
MQRKMHPLALKESQVRWYLSAVDTKDQKLKTFGLDRMLDLDIATTSFREQYHYNINQIFQNTFGIINAEECEPEQVVLSFTAEQGKYIKSFPLHHSQQLISETKEELVFKLNLVVTHDLIMELMKYGSGLKVKMPKHLAQSLKKTAQEMVKNYS